jgi:DNA uptake protein ComE-like DNA-binding protein
METLMIGFTHARRAVICSTLIAVAACTAKTENQTDTASVTGDTGMASSTTTTTTPTPAASGTTASTTGAIVPININTATDAEILAIPGMGPRMLREFKEYRPYTSIEQFRREIGKYVDKAEVARLEKYIVIK